ncbi:MAG: proprotein convertase P-domain-containing protein [Byssovorax sp.]
MTTRATILWAMAFAISSAACSSGRLPDPPSPSCGQDDGNPCTLDSCDNGGNPTHEPVPAGELCGVLHGAVQPQCDGKGRCENCNTTSDCEGRECYVVACIDRVCENSYAPSGTPATVQKAGDCKRATCGSQGEVASEDDDTDVPDDGNPCTDDACTMGVAIHPDRSAGADCGTSSDGDPMTCDGSGHCVGCVKPEDCPGDECKVRTCELGVCGATFVPSGTVTNAQTPGDCLRRECDGHGGFVDLIDDADLPMDDGNSCTDEVCEGGVPMHPLKSPFSSCVPEIACLSGQCVAGVCESLGASACPMSGCSGAQGVCNLVTGLCEEPPDGAPCNDQDLCTQVDTCQGGACVGDSPVVCTSALQCHEPGTCDKATGFCDHPAKPDGTPCDDDNVCSQTDTCVEGFCEGGDFIVSCPPADQCHLDSACHFKLGCNLPAKPDGTPCSDGIACTQGDTCQNGVCVAGPAAGCECGDGVVEPGEACDDGDGASGDGCSFKCAVEPPFTCAAGAPSVCSAPSEIDCNDGADNDGDGLADCADGDCALACNPSVGACGGGEVHLVYQSADVPKSIPDNALSDAASTIFVGVHGKIERVVMQMSITHPHDADLDVKLTSPGNVTTDVTSDNGGAGADYAGTIFNGACAAQIASGVAPFSGCYRPESSFAAHTGGLAHGTWTLGVADDAIGSFGTLTAWSLDLCVTPTACGDGALDVVEACDDGNAVSGDGCDANCKPTGCGNGFVTAGEACDDGNAVGGDGCTGCAIDPGYACAGFAPSVCSNGEALCNNGLDDDGDGLIDAADPDCALPPYFPACGAGQNLVVYRSKDTPKPIPDNDVNGVTSQIVASAGGTIARLAIVLNVTHTFDGDLAFQLTTSGNVNIDASSDNGDNGQDYTDTVLDSTCALPVQNGTAPFSGCYAPETSFGGQVGKPVNGTWKLRAVDSASQDTGTLNGWKLVLCTN